MKRDNLVKKKEDVNRKKYNDKVAKIEEIQRRKSMEMQERKNRSKSPSTVITTLSEFDCTPYTSSKMTFERTSGITSLQITSLAQSSSARTLKHQTTPNLRENGSHLNCCDRGLPYTTNISLNGSRFTTQQNSGCKSKTPDAHLSLSNTPLGSHRRLYNH